MKSISLKVRFDDGTFVNAGFNESLGRFQYDVKEFDPEHRIDQLLKVCGVSEDGIIHVSYIFDGDYEPRHFYFPIGEKLAIEDHIVVNAPKFEQRLQHIALIIESTREEN
ncbi:MAG: hypothetical protein K6F32_06915 [Bacilli bacterium]|nr:hypothetical protein [Bacilli bacterium]